MNLQTSTSPLVSSRLEQADFGGHHCMDKGFCPEGVEFMDADQDSCLCSVSSFLILAPLPKLVSQTSQERKRMPFRSLFNWLTKTPVVQSHSINPRTGVGCTQV